MPRCGMRFLLPCLLATLILSSPVISQVPDHTSALEMQQLVVNPTAGTLKQGQYGLNVHAYGNGGLLAGVSVGLFHRFMFGISYGGEQILGYEEFGGNELPGVLVKYRLIEESMTLPAITIGFQMQGTGPWFEEEERYLYKAPGAFAAVSRNFRSAYGGFGIHAGVNYNTIEVQEQRGWDGYLGVDFSLNEQLTIVGEYDLTLDDNIIEDNFGEGDYGYLNAAVRFSFAKALAIQFDVYDLLNTSDNTEGFGRSLKIIYVETFSL
jgi:hypothetical protein